MATDETTEGRISDGSVPIVTVRHPRTPSRKEDGWFATLVYCGPPLADFGHANIIKHCDRPYWSVGEMDAALIANWNSVVRPTDVVWHLGDLLWVGANPDRYRGCLLGEIHLVRGNHDKDRKLEGLVAEIVDVKWLAWEHHHFWLAHYAHRTWRGSHRGSFHLYGHSHSRLPPLGRSMDVGVDASGMYPVSVEAVVEQLTKIAFAANTGVNSGGDHA